MVVFEMSRDANADRSGTLDVHELCQLARKLSIQMSKSSLMPTLIPTSASVPAASFMSTAPAHNPSFRSSYEISS